MATTNGMNNGMAAGTAMLKIKGLQVSYGGIHAVKGVDLEVGQGELVTLIGANGAGKTTTMKAITGLKPYSAGDIEYMGKSIKGVPSHELLKRGLAMVPEGAASSRACRFWKTCRWARTCATTVTRFRRTLIACSVSSLA